MAPGVTVPHEGAPLALRLLHARACGQESRVCLLRANTADQMLEHFFPAFPALGVKLTDIVVVNFAMWMNTCVAFALLLLLLSFCF